MINLERLIQELCPNGVEYKELGKVCTLVTGATPSKSNPAFWVGGTIPWMSSGEINKRRIFKTESKITQLGYEKTSTTAVPIHTVVIALAGQGKTRGKVAITEIELCTNQSLCSVICKPELDYKFLYYYLDGKYDELRSISNGDGARGGLSLKILSPYKIPVPPLPIQREIVRILDNFTELTAELTAELTVRKKQYEYYRKHLLNNIGEKRSLKAISKKSCSGGTPLKSNDDYYTNGTIPWLRTQEVVFNEIYKTDCFITELAVKETSAKWIPANCVIVAISGASAGRCAINKIPLTTNQHCLNIEINPEIALYKYVFHCVCAQYEELTARKEGARGDLNATRILSLEIPVPPIEEQQRIVSILDRFDTLCNDISNGLPAEIEARQKQYEYYRDKLLTFQEARSNDN